LGFSRPGIRNIADEQNANRFKRSCGRRIACSADEFPRIRIQFLLYIIYGRHLQKLRPDTPENKLVSVGRIATFIVVALGIAWIPIMQNISGVLYEYLQ